MKDKELEKLIEKEYKRQRYNIELIASENYTSNDVLEACGSILTNKYAEGYPNRRYYGGCENIDEVEQLAIDRCKKLFGAEHVNVQPHSGSQANMAVYLSVLQPDDIVLGMDLSAGGHLTHGHKLNFSGKLFNFISYGVDKDGLIDYNEVEKIALENKPKMIVAGASAYPRIIDFKRFKEIADKVDAYLMVDMAHIAGLVAAGLHPSPVPYADFVTSTTHKTLRGPRGGLILCKEKYAKDLDKTVFPGIQGGPLEHIIAGKAVCFYEALQPEFKKYQEMVISNNKALVNTLKELGCKIISDGSDNHLCLVDVKSSFGITGKEAETILDSIGITCNKNTIPFDTEKPAYCSGIRLGTAAMTTRRCNNDDFMTIANIIYTALENHEDVSRMTELRKRVVELTSELAFYGNKISSWENYYKDFYRQEREKENG